jgi:HEAT repeat protein
MAGKSGLLQEAKQCLHRMFWLTVRQLKSGSTRARQKAAKELWREANPRALNSLAAAVLGDPDAEVRQIAASALGRLQAPGRLEPLVKAMHDKEPEVVRSAMLALRRVGDECVIRELVPLLRHHDFGVRSTAAQTIDTIRWSPAEREQRIWFAVAKGWYERAATLGSDALPALRLTVETAPVSAAVRAVEALGSISDPSIVKLLRAALQSQEPAVAIAATGALGKVGGSEAVEALVPCLRSRHTHIRAEAARALGGLGAGEATGPISQLLQDKEWEVRREAAAALGKLNNPETVEPLAKLLDDPDADVRETVAISLSKSGDRRAVGPLILALKDESASVRRVAAAGLSRIDPDWISLPETRGAAEKLKLAIQDAEPAVRFFVAQLLINLGEMSPEAFLGFIPQDNMASPAEKRKRMAASLFIALLQDRDRDVRQAAAEALGHLGDSRSRQPLTRAADDADGDVAAAIQMALQALGTESAS